MKLFGGIYFNKDGVSTSVRGMHLQTALLDNINTNIFLKNILFIALIIRLQKTNVNLTLVYFASN